MKREGWGRFSREKVVKVKADVAAILNFFSHSTPQIEADHLDAVPLVPTVPAAWGEPARPGFPPEGETGKGLPTFCQWIFTRSKPIETRPPARSVGSPLRQTLGRDGSYRVLCFSMAISTRNQRSAIPRKERP